MMTADEMDQIINPLTEIPHKKVLEDYALIYRAIVVINNIADMPHPQDNYYARIREVPEIIIDEETGTITIQVRAQLRRLKSA